MIEVEKMYLEYITGIDEGGSDCPQLKDCTYTPSPSKVECPWGIIPSCSCVVVACKCH